MRIEPVSFEGYSGVRLEDDGVRVTVITSVGPRVLELDGGAGNLLAVLPDAGLDRPDGGRFRLLGGHRLWAAPEVPDVTYQPDERPCAVAEVEDGVRVEAPPDGVGLVRSIEVRRDPEGWVVDHALRNASRGPMTIAPWAITQFRLGGEVELPTGPRGAGPQADRALVLWPYTDPSDPRVRFERDAVRVRAEPGGQALKLGAAPSEGRVAYRLEGQRFEKRISVDDGATYVDRGAAVQVYLNDDFVELETLGPLLPVEPGEQVAHRERWALEGGPA
ncbi:MAG TPA: hypothetical protein VF029_05655 [Actinomycetota bacterium]